MNPSGLQPKDAKYKDMSKSIEHKVELKNKWRISASAHVCDLFISSLTMRVNFITQIIATTKNKEGVKTKDFQQ